MNISLFMAFKIAISSFIVGALLAPTFSTASAHRESAAITKILFNTQTNNIEIMHRFYMHDAEHAVRVLIDKDADVISGQKTRDDFAKYVQERFAIAGDNGEPLPLKLVGHEVEGKFLWVYQETGDVKDLKSLTIIHNALRDIWPNQVNTVNVEGKYKLRTATFDGSIELLTVDLEHK